jgi:hypothetical protein
VEEIKDDLGLAAGDKAGMMARLKAQGVNAAQVSFNDSAGDVHKESAFSGIKRAPAPRSSWSEAQFAPPKPPAAAIHVPTSLASVANSKV